MKPKLELQVFRKKILEKPVQQRKESYDALVSKIEKRENNYAQMMEALKIIRGK